MRKGDIIEGPKHPMDNKKKRKKKKKIRGKKRPPVKSSSVWNSKHESDVFTLPLGPYLT
jgi:hypothetical protein